MGIPPAAAPEGKSVIVEEPAASGGKSVSIVEDPPGTEMPFAGKRGSDTPSAAASAGDSVAEMPSSGDTGVTLDGSRVLPYAQYTTVTITIPVCTSADARI